MGRSTVVRSMTVGRPVTIDQSKDVLNYRLLGRSAVDASTRPATSVSPCGSNARGVDSETSVARTTPANAMGGDATRRSFVRVEHERVRSIRSLISSRRRLRVGRIDSCFRSSSLSSSNRHHPERSIMRIDVVVIVTNVGLRIPFVFSCFRVDRSVFC